MATNEERIEGLEGGYFSYRSPFSDRTTCSLVARIEGIEQILMTQSANIALNKAHILGEDTQ